MNDRSTTKPVDESWVAHLRDLSTGVAPPTAANPHAMSRVAIHRTRTRRAVFATGGGVLTVAAVAGAAFALAGPTAPGVLLPGGSPVSPASASASAETSMSAAERQARALEAAQELLKKDLPEGWHVHELEGLTYAVPPEIVTSGPVRDEPGVTSDMYHSVEDPDAPPFYRIAYYDEGSETPAWPGTADKAGGEEFDLPGAERAAMRDVAAEAAGLPTNTGVPDDQQGPVMFVVERADGPGAYVITLNLPHEDSAELAEQFRESLILS
ncbi:hypothetical protein ACQEVI_20545 [Promicromonospora sp. CA-289599]|uniref:hypothetical protein n=1 Tax=Promicromonospora sp. CA-289599 TaxID=3240014 RepID=UPI003D8F562C